MILGRIMDYRVLGVNIECEVPKNKDQVGLQRIPDHTGGWIRVFTVQLFYSYFINILSYQ